MNAERLLPRIASAFILILLGTLPACAPTATPTVFRPPSGSASPATPHSDLGPAAVIPIVLSTDTFTPAPIQITLAPPCTDGLTYLSDLSIPDGTVVLPNQSVDKQWLVENSGSCNWDSRYRLRWVGGETLGSPTEVALYPARAGARVTLRILFTAPSAAGTYQSQWQAVSPNGTLFGDAVYMQIIVAP